MTTTPTTNKEFTTNPSKSGETKTSVTKLITGKPVTTAATNKINQHKPRFTTTVEYSQSGEVTTSTITTVKMLMHSSTPSAETTHGQTTDASKSTIMTSYPASITPVPSSEIMENSIKCQDLSTIECLIEAGSSQGEMTTSEMETLLSMSVYLLDELSKAVLTGSQLNSSATLTKYCYVLDTMLGVILKDNSVNQSEIIDDLLVRAEYFMDSMLTSISSLDVDQDIRLTLIHIDLLLLQAELPAIKGRKLHMRSGKITVDDVRFDSRVNKRAQTTLAALVLSVPSSKVSLVLNHQKAKYAVVSPVLYLAAAVNNVQINLSHTFSLAVTSPQNATLQPVCGFQIRTESETIWKTVGCSLIEDNKRFCVNGSHITIDSLVNQEHVSCQCNHTTNFAILMQVVEFQIGEKDELVLSIITYMGCSITIITQVIAITVFTCVRSLNSERVCIHRHLCISIMAAQVIFISGVKATRDKIVCSIVALFLHYFYSTSFMWMLVEGLHLYNQIVKVFGTEKSRIIYYTCLGYGLPVLFVAISAAVDWEGYGTDSSCWLSIQRSTIWAFLGPAMAVIFVNCIILVVVIRIVMTSAKLDKKSNYGHIRAGVKAALFLLPLVGLTWVFGMMAVNIHLLIFQYIFAIFNTLQGFFIFMCHCVFNSEVRYGLKRIQEKRRLRRSDLVNTPSTYDRPTSTETRSSSSINVAIGQIVSSGYRKTNKVEPSNLYPFTTEKSKTRRCQ